MTIEVFDPISRSWSSPFPLDFHASTTPTHFQRDLYAWDVKLNFVPNCFDAQGLARIRVKERIAGQQYPTYMFDQAGIECLWARYAASGASLDAVTAGSECSNGRTEVTVHKSGKLHSSFASCAEGFGGASPP
jgi:hypothetical protein